MIRRSLGRDGLEVGAIGYGAMPLNWEYGTPVGVETARSVIHRALDLGVTLIDTSDAYGDNEVVVGQALRGRRPEAVLATKCGLVVTNESPIEYGRDGSAAHIRQACDASLRRLETDVIDLYQLHRVDPDVPVEESVGAMAELVEAGKVRAIGLSEVDVATLERANRVHPISTVQSELSLWTRGPLASVVPWCDDNGVAFLPFSPLGRGYLTGRLTPTDMPDSDWRRGLPRFTPAAMEANQRIVDGISAVAGRHGATNAQVALAWLLAKSPAIVPIPGTKTVRYLEENAAAVDLELTEADIAQLDDLPDPVGDRY